MFHVTAWMILLVQSALVALPPVPVCCLACTGEACSGKAACCEACRETNRQPASRRCVCTAERLPVALRGAVSSAPEPETIVAWLRPYVAEGCAARTVAGKASVRSDDLPDIPLRILFCTWLE